MESQLIKDYLIVHLEGNCRFNIDGISSAFLNGSISKYTHLSGDRFTMMDTRLQRPGLSLNEVYWVQGKMQKNSFRGTDSFLYYSLLNLISKSTSDDGVWFDGNYIDIDHEGVSRNLSCDTLFYDEFIFLTSENLIQFEDATFLTEDQIWNNFNKSIAQSNENFDARLQPMFDSKSIEELRKEYRKLVLSTHPDITGTEATEFMTLIVDAYLILKKTF